MSTIKIDKRGHRPDGVTHDDTIVKLAQSLAFSASAALSGVTDNSGGTASTSNAVLVPATDAVNVADAGTTTATGTSTAAKLNLVKDALLEVATKANAVAAVVGVTALTYNGGGTAADGTIGAIGGSTAGTTGTQASNYNTTLAALNGSVFTLARFINKLAVAAGRSTIDYSGITGYTYSSTVAAITVATGADASPGVTKTRVDADLGRYANTIATLAAVLNDLTGTWAPSITVTN